MTQTSKFDTQSDSTHNPPASQAGSKGRKPAGRPSKRTEETLAKLCKAVADGLPIKAAARLAGVDESLVHRWKREDPKVAECIAKAEAESEGELLKMAKAGAAKDGRIAIMLLERRFPQQWGKPSERVEVRHTSPVQIPNGIITPAVLAQLVEQRRLHDLRHAEERAAQEKPKLLTEGSAE